MKLSEIWCEVEENRAILSCCEVFQFFNRFRGRLNGSKSKVKWLRWDVKSGKVRSMFWNN